MKNRRGIVERIPPSTFSEPHDRRDPVARKRCKHGVQLPGFDVDREGVGLSGVVSEASQYTLRAAQDLNVLGLAPVDSFTNEAKGDLRRIRGKQRCLVGGYSQWFLYRSILPASSATVKPSFLLERP